MSKGLSKKSIFLLAPIVIIIWGLIIYRVLDMTSPAQNFSIETPSMYTEIVADQSKREELSLDYNDPFGLQTGRSKKVDPKKTRRKGRNVKAIQWPELKYHGMVKAKQGQKQITIISIGGKQHFFAAKQEVEQIKLLNTWIDSARVSYQDSLIKVIYK